MSSMLATTQPKTPRGNRHQQSRSAAPSSDNDSSTQTQQAQNQKRTNRRNNQRNGPGPAYQNTNGAMSGQGGFDENGNFIAASNLDASAISDEAPMYEDMEVVSGVKRASKKQPRAKNPPRQNGGVSPPRMNHAPQYNIQPMNAPAPAITMTPPKPAYAGPTFHASPAASSLPLPKFFSKSVPATTSQSSMQARLDQESDKSDKTDSPPLSEATPALPNPLLPTPPRQEESPLDILFKADKEEKAKRKSFGVLNTPTTQPATLHVNSEPPRAHAPTSPAWASIYPQHHTRQPSNGAGKGMFMMELDGNAVPVHNGPPPVPAGQITSFRSATAPSAIPQTAPSMRHTSNNFAMNHPVYSSPNHGNSTPALVSLPSPPSSGYQDTSASPFYRPNLQHTPRSADSTPIPNNAAYNQQPLHYGNRNLSPVFKAVKQDSVKRTSSLRQELHASSPKYGPAELPDNAFNTTPSRHPISRADQAALAYLQSHVPPPPAMPKFDLRSLSNSSTPASFAPPSELPAQPPANSISAQHQDAFQSNSGSRQSPLPQNEQRTAPVDVKTMEQDLRRILNLNAFGSTPGVPSVR
jgi:hypothetical protein